MIFTYVGGTSQQVGWAQSAVASCLYPLGEFTNTVTVHFTDTFPTGLDTSHPYMATTAHYAGHINTETFDIYVKTWADNPDHPENQGIPDPQSNIQEFFIESFVHEIGHVVMALTFDPGLLGADLRVGAVCELFWRSNVLSKNGRDQGTAANYSADWDNAIKETVAECFKSGFCPNNLVFKNRTNWHIDAADWVALMTFLAPHWKYDTTVIGEGGVVAYENFVNTLDWSSQIGLSHGGIGIPNINSPDVLSDGAPILTSLSTPSFDLRPAHASPWLPFPDFPLIPIDAKSQAAWGALAEAFGAPTDYNGMSDEQRAGWHAIRHFRWAVGIPGTGWGFVQLDVTGQYLKSDSTADTINPQFHSLGVNPAATPWGSDPSVIVGTGPPAPFDPSFVAGWYGTTPRFQERITLVDEVNTTAIVDWYVEPGDYKFLAPGVSTNPPAGTTANKRVPSLSGRYVFPVRAHVGDTVKGTITWAGYDISVDRFPDTGQPISHMEVAATFFPVLPVLPVIPPYPFGGPGTIAVGRGLRGAVGVITPSGRQSTGAPVMVNSAINELVQSNYRRGAEPGPGLRGHVLRPAGDPRK